MSPARFAVGALRLPKRGSAASECEDAVAFHATTHRAGGTGAPIAIAVSDGASESLLAKDWAHMLAHHLAHEAFSDPAVLEHDSPRYTETIVELKREWERHLAEHVRAREASDRRIQWYEYPKLEAGASATLLAFRLEASIGAGIGSWRAVAVGDTCLFQVRAGEIVRCFPLDRPEQFSRAPDLLRSRGPETMHDRPHFAEGAYTRGDVFFLMTDAVARWFLHVAHTSTTDAFTSQVALLRAMCLEHDAPRLRAWTSAHQDAGCMQNDDITCAFIGAGE